MSGENLGAKAVMKHLRETGFSFSKAKGQNFLIDANVPEKLVRLSGIDCSCGVLEVGAGLGALTSALSRVAGRVIAVEIDDRLIPALRDLLADAENVDIVKGDILKLDVADLAPSKMPGMKYHVCANLPYSITTPTLTMLIDSGIFETITVMVQKEVAQRICAKPGSSDYGAFSVFVNYHAEPLMLFDVPPECFVPRPAVISSVVTLKMRKERLLSSANEAFFFRVVRAAFEHRRKTLVNALFMAFGNTIQKADIEMMVRDCGFDTRIRGEKLGINEFSRLSETLKSNTER